MQYFTMKADYRIKGDTLYSERCNLDFPYKESSLYGKIVKRKKIRAWYLSTKRWSIFRGT